MPQIAQIASTYASQLFWLLVTFGLLYFVVGRGMVPKIVATVDQRDARIAGDLAAAEQARIASDRTEAAWRAETDAARSAAQAATAAAKARAAGAYEGQVKAADADLSERMTHHDLAIANAKADAMANIQALSVEAAQAMVVKLAGVEVTAEQASDALRRATAHG